MCIRDSRVIAPDRRGYGATRPPARDFPDNFYEREARDMACLLYTSDAADERSSVDLGGRRIIKKKKKGKWWRVRRIKIQPAT